MRSNEFPPPLLVWLAPIDRTSERAKEEKKTSRSRERERERERENCPSGWKTYACVCLCLTSGGGDDDDHDDDDNKRCRSSLSPGRIICVEKQKGERSPALSLKKTCGVLIAGPATKTGAESSAGVGRSEVRACLTAWRRRA